MEHVDENTPSDESNQETKKLPDIAGVWVVLKSDGTHGAIGRVAGHTKLNEKTRREILFGDNKPLALDIAFDYAEIFRPVPVTGPDGVPVMGPSGPMIQMAREPLVTNVGFIFDECTTYFRGWVRLNFFDDMRPADRKRYEDFRDSAIRGSQERRAKELGIVDPRSVGLDPNDPRIKRMPDQNGKPHFQVDLRNK